MRIIVLLLIILELSFAQKLALVIGNSNYAKGYLANPINDAKLIAKTLREVGFTVTVKKDLKTKTAMENAINTFAKTVSTSDTVAIYYSGHGVQYNGNDYLMPTNANIAKKGQLPSVSLDVNFLLGGVSDAKLAIIMLDACRNNPYRSFIRGIPKGLGQASVTVDGGMIISYATEANQIANDGNGANSPYALALATYIKTSDPIETVFRKVRGEVSRRTDKEQKPMAKMLFDGEFSFMARHVPPPKPIVVVNPAISQPVYVPKPVPVVSKPKTNSSKNTVSINNLTYQNQHFTKEYNWQDAKDYCQGLTLDGHSDWRLPNRKELNAIRTKKSSQSSKGYPQYIRKEFIENLPKYNNFWSSTTSEKDSSYAWLVSFYNGGVDWRNKVNYFYALCVR